MFRVGFLVIAVLVASAPPLGAAERARVVPVHALHIVNPSLKLAPRADSPLEQQIQQNYRTQLLQAQRELLQYNPSGLGRAQIAIGHLLDTYDAAPR